MSFRFKISSIRNSVSNKNLGILYPDKWDDFNFRTTFQLSIIDELGVIHTIGGVKIGFFGQTHDERTQDVLPKEFEVVESKYFSLGQDVDYYKKISNLGPALRDEIMRSLRDIVYDSSDFNLISGEQVYTRSIGRDISAAAIFGQFKRVLDGGAALTPFHFGYRGDPMGGHAAFNLDFTVEPESKPPTNIHVLIGRNGVGKTTLLNQMVLAVTNPYGNFSGHTGFFELSYFGAMKPIGAEYFGGVVSVSFSAFDPFLPPPDQRDQLKGMTNFYIGLKSRKLGDDGEYSLKTRPEINAEFAESVKVCLSFEGRRKRWLAAIEGLQSDEHFESMNLQMLSFMSPGQLESRAKQIIGSASSGHATVLLTITRLVETVEEKTLVLIDEPESHLHPPLLSAFVRALSDLLSDRNAVAIIATHSPVVVQEVPRSCVWKLYRSGAAGVVHRPEDETFGENVSALNRDIFQLEVSKSGFHNMLSRDVNEGRGYEQIIREYNGQLGHEARALLRALIAAKTIL